MNNVEMKGKKREERRVKSVTISEIVISDDKNNFYNVNFEFFDSFLSLGYGEMVCRDCRER